MEFLTLLKVLAVACFITGCASTDRPIMYDDPYVTASKQTDMLRAIKPLKDQPIIDIASSYIIATVACHYFEHCFNPEDHQNHY